MPSLGRQGGSIMMWVAMRKPFENHGKQGVLKVGKSGSSIYFTEGEKYDRPTVTFKEPSSRKQNHTSYNRFELTKLTNPQNRTRETNFLQKVRPTKTRPNFLRKNYRQTVPPLCCLPHDPCCCSLRCRRERRKEERKKPKICMGTHSSPSLFIH